MLKLCGAPENWACRRHRKWSLNRQFQWKSKKNYRAHPPKNLDTPHNFVKFRQKENIPLVDTGFPGVCSFCWILCQLMRALIDVLIALQWKSSHLLDTKQPKFIEWSTPLGDTINPKGRDTSPFFGKGFAVWICKEWYQEGGLPTSATVYQYSILGEEYFIHKVKTVLTLSWILFYYHLCESASLCLLTEQLPHVIKVLKLSEKFPVILKHRPHRPDQSNCEFLRMFLIYIVPLEWLVFTWGLRFI